CDTRAGRNHLRQRRRGRTVHRRERRPARGRRELPVGERRAAGLLRRKEPRRASVRDDKHVDREVLRPSAFRRWTAEYRSERRPELLLHEALEGLSRLPDVIDVVALLTLAGTVRDQALGRLVLPHRRRVTEHLLG